MLLCSLHIIDDRYGVVKALAGQFALLTTTQWLTSQKQTLRAWRPERATVAAAS